MRQEEQKMKKKTITIKSVPPTKKQLIQLYLDSFEYTMQEYRKIRGEKQTTIVEEKKK